MRARWRVVGNAERQAPVIDCLCACENPVCPEEHVARVPRTARAPRTMAPRTLPFRLADLRRISSGSRLTRST
jgi:hypothetical protein